MGFQTSSEVLHRTDFRYFFNQALPQCSDASSKCPKLPYTAVLSISHEERVASIRMGFSRCTPCCQCCVLSHGLSFLHNCAIHLHNRKHVASHYSGTRDSLTRWGNRSDVSDCYCSCLYLYLLWTINLDDPMKGCDHESQLAEQCYFMEGRVRQ